MSWFTSGLETLSQLSEKVQKAIPVDKELLAKLTLNTDEMKAERQQFGDEAKRKHEVKDMLAGMLPWETRDTERDILVEECKEAILSLSSDVSTFYGPYQMPQLNVNLEEEKKKKEGEDEEECDEDDEDNEEEAKEKKTHEPSPESLEKLSKLEPLPPLLRDFDLDSHVGLIQRLLKEDPRLEIQQSTLSGGGAREKVFWHNYFFHCAYTRYEAGLSIDEIWSFQPEKAEAAKGASEKAEEEASSNEEVVVFDDAEEEPGPASDSPAFTPDETDADSKDFGAGEASEYVDPDETSPSGSAASEFEMLDDNGTGDPELDELEAEIARELED